MADPLCFEGERYPDSTFRSLDLSNARFDGVNLSGATFHNVNMSNVKFGDINMRNAKFSAIDIAGTRFNCTSAGIGDRERIPLQFGPNFHVSNSTFVGADLDGVTIKECNLRGARIEGCDTEGMTIDGVSVADMMAAYRSREQAGAQE